MIEWLNKPMILGISALWYVLMAFFVALPCSQIGAFLMLRRMSLVGDAISHSVLPGIVIAFVLIRDVNSPWIFVGATLAGMLVTFLIEQIHQKTRMKQDAAIGIAFTALFAFGVLLVGLFAGRVHLDAECVVYGELTDITNYREVPVFGYRVPQPLFIAGVVALFTLIVIKLSYRVLLVTSFDAQHATAIGYKPALVQHLLMGMLSLVVVNAFVSVGAILVIALLIIPAATAYLCTHRLVLMMFLSGFHALISSVVALYVYAYLNCSFAAAMVVTGLSLFVLAWLFGPADGIVVKAFLCRIKVLDNQAV